MNKFKAGDKVRMISDHSQTDTVESVPGMKVYHSHALIDLKSGFILEGRNWESQRYWELIPKEEPEERKSKFKIGDRVEIINSAFDLNGVTGTISRIDNNGEYWCEDWSDNDSGSMRAKKLKLINKKDEGEEKEEFYPFPNMWPMPPMPNPFMGLRPEGIFIDEASSAPAESKIKNMLREIPRTLKRVLNPSLSKQYRAGLIDGDLELTEEGRDEMLEILSQETFIQDGLTKYADEIIDRERKARKNK